MTTLLLLKVSVILFAALVAARLLHRAPATTRHRLWSVAFAAMLLMPALAAWMPALRIPVPASWTSGQPTTRDSSMTMISIEPARTSLPAPLQAPTSTKSTAPAVSAEPARLWPGLSTVLFAIWLAGAVGAIASVAHSLLEVRRLARTAEAVSDEAWQGAATAVRAQLGLRPSVALLASADIGTPMAGGIWRRAIFLPSAARTWSAEHRDLVLAHEMAHLAGHDPLRHLMTRLALACYWFHPLAWLAAREAHIAREQACDEAVLALGARPSAYARLLLELAETASHRSQGLLGALPMVQRSQLEKRLMAILHGDLRPTSARLLAAPVIGVAVLTLSVAAAQPQTERTHASLPGGVQAGIAGGVSAGVIGSVPAGIAGGTAAGVRESANVGGLQRSSDQQFACWSDTRADNFRGRSDTIDVGGRTRVTEMIGMRDGDRIIQRSFGDLRLCLVAENLGDRAESDRPSQWIGRARRIVMEARRGRDIQRLELSGSTPAWEVNGRTRAFDAAAQTWRDRMLAVLDTTWEISTLQGERSALQGQISAIEGQRSALQGEISALQGEVSAMQGRISSAQGVESSLRGEISSIQGHVSSLQGAISAQQGAISSLSASRYDADSSERSRINSRIAEHEAQIARIQRQIRDYDADTKIAAIERQITSYDATGKARSVEDEIRRFDLNRKVAAIERRIDDLDVRGKVAGIERQIAALDVDRRVRQFEDRLDGELTRLNSAISAVR